MRAGRVGRPHGLDGSVHVRDPLVIALQLGRRVMVAGTPRTIVRRAGTNERPILRLEGIETRDAAAALAGVDLEVPIDELEPLEEGEWWSHELEACAVVDGQRPVGHVRRLLTLPSCDVLEVERPDDGDLLVPLVTDAVREVDVERRRIDVDLEFLGEG